MQRERSALPRLAHHARADNVIKVITTSRQDVIEEYFSHHQNLDSHVEGKFVYK